MSRMELTKDEVTLLLRCVYDTLDAHSMEGAPEGSSAHYG
jgi:hypothetical protein